MLGLRECSEFFGKEILLVWDRATDTFLPSTTFELLGRFSHVDRFVTIYNRPTRMRNLIITPEQALPASLVAQDADGIVYLLSQTRRVDRWDDSTYQGLVASRRCDPPTGGKAEVFRPTVSGVGLDLGFVTLDPVGVEYCDTELRSASKQELAPGDEIGHTFAAFSNTANIRDGDFCLLDGRHLALTELYADSGFLLTRAIVSRPRYENFYYEENLPGSYGYVVSSGRVPDISSTAYGFSALRLQGGDSTTNTGEQLNSSLLLSVRKEHVGFTFKPGFRILSGTKIYVISSVVEDGMRTSWVVDATRIAR